MPIEIYLKPLEATPENLSVKSSESKNSWNSLDNLLPNKLKTYIYNHDSKWFDLSNIQTKSNKIRVVSKSSR